MEAMAMAEMILRIRVQSLVNLGAQLDAMEKLTRKFIKMGKLEVPVKLGLRITRQSLSLEFWFLHFFFPIHNQIGKIRANRSRHFSFSLLRFW
jgi:hypothetical protein